MPTLAMRAGLQALLTYVSRLLQDSKDTRGGQGAFARMFGTTQGVGRTKTRPMLLISRYLYSHGPVCHGGHDDGTTPSLLPADSFAPRAQQQTAGLHAANADVSDVEG